MKDCIFTAMSIDSARKKTSLHQFLPVEKKMRLLSYLRALVKGLVHSSVRSAVQCVHFGSFKNLSI